ncbi:MAG TPA: TolC family protein [Polyangiaceae bacterium]|nr:TolC family protein [Polyangiaceae bacterium]
MWHRAKVAAPEVVRANGQVLLAKAAGVGARMSSFQNPYFEVYVDRRVSSGSQGLGVSGILWIPFEIAGQRSARIDESDSLLDWQKTAHGDAEARAVGAVVVAYGDTIVAAARLAQAEIAEHQAQAEVDYFSARANVGDATVVDKALAEAEVARYAQLRAEAGIALVRSREQVAVLTAMPDLESPKGDVATDPPPLRLGDPDTQAQAVVERSPLLRALDGEARFYDRQRDRAEAERSSPVSAIVTAGRGEFGDARVGGGVAWTFPIIRRNQGEIARASAGEARAKAERGAFTVALRSRARADAEEYQQTLAAIGALDRTGLPAASRVADATLASFKAGKAELIRVINARRDLAVARSRRLDLVQGAWRAFGDLAAMRGELP